METYFWSNENGSHHQVNVSYLWLHLILTLFTFPCYTKPLQKSLLCYAVLEIVPVLVWQNADCHIVVTVSINIFLFASMFHLCLLTVLNTGYFPEKKDVDTATYYAPIQQPDKLWFYFFIGDYDVECC